MKKISTEIRVRYQETDAMGVVYYANYFVWFEVARTEYLRAHGISYRTLEEEGVFMMVANASCAYKYPARYDDLVRIETWVAHLRNSSFDFAYELYVGERLIATGESVHVMTSHARKPIRIPERLRAICSAPAA